MRSHMPRFLWTLIPFIFNSICVKLSNFLPRPASFRFVINHRHESRNDFHAESPEYSSSYLLNVEVNCTSSSWHVSKVDSRLSIADPTDRLLLIVEHYWFICMYISYTWRNIHLTFIAKWMRINSHIEATQKFYWKLLFKLIRRFFKPDSTES